VPFAVLTPGGQSGNFWIHPRIKVSFGLGTLRWSSVSHRGYTRKVESGFEPTSPA